MLCVKISAAAAAAKFKQWFSVARRWHSDVCALKFCPPPLKLCIEILPPPPTACTQILCPPLFHRPPAVNNDHSPNQGSTVYSDVHTRIINNEPYIINASTPRSLCDSTIKALVTL